MPSVEIIEIVGPAFAAGLLIIATHAPLGLEVLKRGIIFIDLAIAQIAGLGLIAANTLTHEPVWWQSQLAALCFALGGALFFHIIERKAPARQEAIIGCSFIVAASLALLLLANDPHGGEEVTHLLSGQILFVSWDHVAGHAPVYLGIIALWWLVPSLRRGIGFYVLFAAAITSSVQLVGVYVVFASLIMPALAAGSYKRPVAAALLNGWIGVTMGLVLSVITDLPAGPLLVITLAGTDVPPK